MRLVGQFSRFFVVGILNTSVDLVVLNAETLLTGVREGAGFALQKGISFSVAVAFSYLLNKNWTFRAPEVGGRGRFSRFFGVSVAGALINVAVATAVVTYVKDWVGLEINAAPLADQLWVNVAALCGTGTGLLWNFAGYRQIVFRP